MLRYCGKENVHYMTLEGWMDGQDSCFQNTTHLFSHQLAHILIGFGIVDSYSAEDSKCFSERDVLLVKMLAIQLQIFSCQKWPLFLLYVVHWNYLVYQLIYSYHRAANQDNDKENNQQEKKVETSAINWRSIFSY